MARRSAGARLRAEIERGLPPGMELDERERAILDLAARQADDLARLEADIAKRGTVVPGSRAGSQVLNPSLAEARQARLALGKLLAQLELPEPAGARSEAARRAQRAAEARWARRAG